MKKLIAILLTAVTLLCLSLPALADTDDAKLTVAGSATVSLAADTATLEIGAYTTDQSVQAAQSANAAIMERVIAALINLGVDKTDIITSSFNVYEDSLYDASADVSKTVYAVNNMLYITVRKLESVGAIIDAATGEGANRVYGLTFSSSKAAEAYQKALVRAYDDALAKAETLAAACGKTLGAILSIDAPAGYSSGNYGVTNSMEMMDAGAAAKVIVSGDVSVTAGITVEFEMK